MYIIGGKIVTMEGDVWENGYICIENGKIRELGLLRERPRFLLWLRNFLPERTR